MINACSVTRPLKKNEYLLIKNKVKADQRQISTDDLSAYLQQAPNKKLFGIFRANIAFYNWGMKGKNTKFKKWLRTTPGAEPVLLDTSLTHISSKQMKMYLANKGYFQAQIHDSAALKKKKARVYYQVTANQPYKIRKFSYAIPDKHLASFVYRDTAKSLIRPGSTFDAYALDDERTRITGNLVNYGFFRFNTGYIFYRIDSTLNSHQMDVVLEITNPVVPSLTDFTTVVQVPHRQSRIGEIFINPNYDHLATDTIFTDTVARTYEGYRDKPPVTYFFLNNARPWLKPKPVAQAIFITPDSYYNLRDVNSTYSQLSGLQVFKYVNISFTESRKRKPVTDVYTDYVDCKIQLSRAAPHSFTITTDGTNSSGALGVQGNLSYQNRNIFKGAQLLKLNLTGAAQAQAVFSGDDNSALFNTLEFGLNASLTFPQFLIPIRQEKLPKHFKPKTSVSAGYNFQLQPDYNRHIANLAFGYTWIQSEKIKHILNPAEITLVKIYPDSLFVAYINSQQDKRLKNQYTDHLVAGLRYSFTFSNQNVATLRNFVYLRANFETGGNLLYLIDKAVGAPVNNDGYYTLFDIQYSQYVRPDADFRLYNLISRKTSLVWRLYAGIGIPYGNSTDLPFEKAFFAGGANGMRGWKMGYLGPGSYHNDTLSGNFNQLGDIQLETNLEYRFPIYKMLKGSVFVDAGNIWLLKESADLPGGKFYLNEFWKQIAIDFGLGIRLDFDFFIFRFDPAVPIRVPWYPENECWNFNKIKFRDIVWNFGIGYPF